MRKAICPSCRCRTASMDSSLRRNDNSQRGSALVYIFIGIALFGALMFAFSRGGSQNTSALSDQQARIVATEIINYSRSVESAVQKLIAKGCSENEISFQNSVVASYNNTNAPSDKRCHVFDTNGGKVNWQIPPASVPTPDGQYIFTNSYLFGLGTGVGTAGLDIVIVLRNLPTAVCQQINNTLKVTKTAWRTADSNNIPIEDNSPNFTYGAITPTARFFVGYFTFGYFIGDTESALAKDTLRCIKDDNTPEYIFIGTLLAR